MTQQQKTPELPAELSVEMAEIGELTHHPDNPRRGDVGAIADSLTENRQYKPIIVQKSTGRVLAGNHTLDAARHLGWKRMAVIRLDVDDARARKILLADNRTADQASYDSDALLAILQDMDGDLAGTGYTDDDLDTLLFTLGQQEATEFSAPDTDAHYNETDEQHAEREEKVAERAAGSNLAAKGLSETILILGVSERNELLDNLEKLRDRWGEELSNGQIVYEAVRRAVAQDAE